MAMSIDVLEEELMRLGDSDRKRLLARLLDPLLHQTEIDQASIEEAWLAEAMRRKLAVENGEVAMIPGDEAMARLEQLLA